MTRAVRIVAFTLVSALAACEESTSGADHEAPRSRFDTGSNAGTSATGGTSTAGSAGSSSDCGEVTEVGSCDGDSISFCDDGELVTGDCRTLDPSCRCGPDPGSGVYDCLCATAGSGGMGGLGGSAATGGSSGNATGGSATAGSSGSGAGTAGADSTLADAIARGVDVECARLAACSSTLLEFWFGGLTGCRNQTRDSLEWLSALTDSGFTTDYLDRCYDAVETATCEQYFSAVPLESCVARGTRENGASCVHSAQCASGFALPPTSAARRVRRGPTKAPRAKAPSTALAA